jgi:hypothetical protein
MLKFKTESHLSQKTDDPVFHLALVGQPQQLEGSLQAGPDKSVPGFPLAPLSPKIVCIPPKFHNNQLNPIIHLKVYVF